MIFKALFWCSANHWLATSTWAAMQGRRALDIKWNRGPHENESTESFWEQAAFLAGHADRALALNPGEGDLPEGVEAADQVTLFSIAEALVTEQPDA